MSESFLKWLSERRFVWAVLSLISLTGLVANGKIGDGVFATCFVALSTALLATEWLTSVKKDG